MVSIIILETSFKCLIAPPYFVCNIKLNLVLKLGMCVTNTISWVAIVALSTEEQVDQEPLIRGICIRANFF